MPSSRESHQSFHSINNFTIKVETTITITHPEAKKNAIPPHSPTAPRHEPFFPFLSLPPSLQDQILTPLLLHNEPFRPCYAPGRLYLGPWSPGLDHDSSILPPRSTPLPSLFFVSRSLSTRSTTLFYSLNTFTFSCASFARDFLLTRHHHHHLPLIRRLRLDILSGKLCNGDTMEQIQERQWNDLLVWMRPRHSLQVLLVNLKGWKDIRFRADLGAEEKQEIFDERLRVIETLKTFTVPRCVVVGHGAWMTQREYDGLALLVQQGKKRVPAKIGGEKGEEVGLEEVLRRCREARLEREAGEARRYCALVAERCRAETEDGMRRLLAHANRAPRRSR
ncbi:MAG: hypothetical protein Q9227_008441 [Pyrenula ochraceoflavens]